ncbi:MAG: amidohydrolase family protein [Acidobacteriota bacterium]|nr:amidohydrolase family protein [Acidobacteriota bacterium]
MKNVRLSFRALVLATVFAALVSPAAADGGGDLLIKNGTLLTVTGGVIPRGDILIQGGIIRRIGENIPAPPGIRIVDASGKYVMPGIIDSHTHIALSGTNEGTEAIVPEVDMADVVHADDVSILTALSGGVTMVHTMHGSANPIGGQNVTLKTKWGRPSEELVVREATPTLKFALGENVKQSNRQIAFNVPRRYPATRMGANAIIRREFQKARDYMARWERYERLKASKNPPKNLLPPRKDLALEVLAAMLRGEIVARCHTYQATETLEFLELSREFGFKIGAFEHAWEAYKIADELAEAGIGISIFADSWAYKMEAAEGIAPTAAYCAQRGVLVSINSDSGERIRRLFNDAGKAVKSGLSPEEALKLITINPAIQMGVEKIAGSLEVGKHGDIAVFNEHPMSAYARCDMTVIEGEIYFDREQYLKDREAAVEKGGAESVTGGTR